MKNLRDKSFGVVASIGVAILELTFQLLICYVVTDPPTPVEGQIMVTVQYDLHPEIIGCRLFDKKDQIFIRVTSIEGELSRFDVDAAAFAKKGITNLSELSKELDIIPKKDMVELILDLPDDVSYQKVISFMDALRFNGFEDVWIGNEEWRKKHFQSHFGQLPENDDPEP